MLAVHFGAGNIGRGFIGQMLSEAGYEICFVDVNQNIIDDINKLRQYHIEIVGDKPSRILVKNISAINCSDEKLVNEKIVQADVVTTALGPNVLKLIAPAIAKGLVKRIEVKKEALNIIACENMIGGSSVLKRFVYEHLTDKQKKEVKEWIGFPDAAVDRIVPLQNNEEKLLVQTEKFFEWDVDSQAIVGARPPINGVNYVDNLQAYIERKLFAVNAAHAAIAYLGYVKGISSICDALKNDEIAKIVRLLLKETGQLLCEKYNFNLGQYNEYIETILKRFSSSYISDEVTRVGRSPIRKLGPNDRLAFPISQLAKKGIIADGLAIAIAAGLCFDYENDVEAVKLQDAIQSEGVEKVLEKYCGIDGNSKIGKFILKKYVELKENIKYV